MSRGKKNLKKCRYDTPQPTPPIDKSRPFLSEVKPKLREPIKNAEPL